MKRFNILCDGQIVYANFSAFNAFDAVIQFRHAVNHGRIKVPPHPAGAKLIAVEAVGSGMGIVDIHLRSACNALDAHIHGAEISPYDMTQLIEHLDSWNRVVQKKVERMVEDMQENPDPEDEPIMKKLQIYLQGRL